MRPTLAALHAAIRADDVRGWLAAANGPGRDTLSRVIAHDRSLWSQYPDSLPSCLLARTLGIPELAELHASWLAEVAGAANPWIRPFQPLPLTPGLLATLSSSPTLDLSGLNRIAFPTEDSVTLEPIRFHPNVQAPEDRRKERLVWSWKTGDSQLLPFPEIAGPAPDGPFPHFETRGWGPAHMIREAGARPVELPCPPEGSAHAQSGRAPGTVVVYGSHDEYAGGFVWFVRSDSLTVTRRLETSTPVWSVDESANGAIVLARTSNGLVCWARGWFRETERLIRIDANEVALSPSGGLLAARTDRSIQIWSVAEAPVGLVEGGLPTSFSPDGARLIRGSTLYDGQSGHAVALISTQRSGYLEGGPAHPWLYLGDRFLICLWSDMKVWSSADGSSVNVEERLFFPQWFKLAYDRAGEKLAALRKQHPEVLLHAIPSGRLAGKVVFELEHPEAIALSPSGRLLAVSQGDAVEVRTTTGELLAGAHHPLSVAERERPDSVSLEFLDEERLVRHVLGAESLVFQLKAGAVAIGSFRKDCAPPGWTVVKGGVTLFEHRPTQTRIALPVSGDWIANPARPTILACSEAHVELRAPSFDMAGD
jgi:hypothetical protein